MKEKKTFLRRLLRFIRRLFYEADEFLYVQRPLGNKPFVKASSDFIVRFGGVADLQELGTLRPQKKKLFAARLQAGHDVLCIDKDGALVGYIWWAKSPYYEPKENIIIPVTDQDVYAFDAWVIPSLRQQGSHRVAESLVDCHYLSLGRSRNLSVLRNDPTIPAYHMHKHLGFTPLSLIRYRRILWIKRCRFLPFEGTF